MNPPASNLQPTECFAVPGVTMIDTIHPVTGLTVCFGHTLEECRREYPAAVKMTIAEFCQSKAALQDCPVTWDETTEEKYFEMLEVLPPACMVAGGFLVGEPMDHHAGNGRPRFSAFIVRDGKHLASSRPMTRQEFLAFMPLDKSTVQTLWSRGKSIAQIETILAATITFAPGATIGQMQRDITDGNFEIVRKGEA